MSALLRVKSLATSMRMVCDTHCLQSDTAESGSSGEALEHSETVCYRFNREKALAYLAAKVRRLAAYLQKRSISGAEAQLSSGMSSAFRVGTSTVVDEVQKAAGATHADDGRAEEAAEPAPAFMTQALEILAEDLPEAWVDRVAELLG